MKFAAELMCFRSIWGGDDSAKYASKTIEGNLKGDLTSLTRTSPSNSVLITYKKKPRFLINILPLPYIKSISH